MPARKRPRRYQKRSARRRRQIASGSGKQRAIGALELGPPNLAAHNFELVAEHEQLDILEIRATPAANKQAEETPNSEVEEGEEHAAILAAAAQRSPRPE